MAAGTDINTQVTRGFVRTTDNTTTTVASFTVDLNNVIVVEAYVVGRRTGGSGGTAGDACAFLLTSGAKSTSAGSITQIGSTQTLMASKDNNNCSASLNSSSNQVLIQVTGDTNNNYDWSAVLTITKAF